MNDLFCPDCLEVTTVVVVQRGVGKTSPLTSI